MKIKAISLSFLFITQFVWADDIIQNIIGGCNTNNLNVFDNMSLLSPHFIINSYNCNNGYYLPKDALSCASCPYGHNCPGGTYTYDPDKDQGISYKKTISENVYNGCDTDLLFPNEDDVNLLPVFIPENYSCAPGYYLAADAISCAQCPLNNKCVGGTYTFNETTTQGIELCPAGTFAPTGSAVCYDHILHVGNEFMYLRSTKLTTPSLNVAYGDNVYYANTTTTPTPITAGSQHYLKVIYNDVEYYICDDTTYQQ